MKLLLAVGLLCVIGTLAIDSDEVPEAADNSEETVVRQRPQGPLVGNSKFKRKNVHGLIRSEASDAAEIEQQSVKLDEAVNEGYSSKLTFQNGFPNLQIQDIFNNLFPNIGNLVGDSPSTRSICTCGDRDRSISSEETGEIREFPWVTQIIRVVDDSLLCAGSIISTMNVLTAAHCVVGHIGNPEGIVVRVGTDNRRVLSGAQYLVGSVQVHEGYNNVENNNVAILTLQRPLEFSNRVGPICIPPTNQDFNGKEGMLTTWGTNAPVAGPNSLLFKSPVTMRNFRYCRWTFGYRFLEITSNAICASHIGRNGCLGYNGGVLVQDDDASTSYQTGIVSFGVGCEQERFALVFTNVMRYRNWIMDNVPDEYKCFTPSEIPDPPDEDAEPPSPPRRRQL